MPFEGARRSAHAKASAGGPNGESRADAALQLDEPKLLGALISGASSLWFRQPGVFVAAAALIVIPFQVIVVGVLGGTFSSPTGAAAAWSRLLSLFSVNVLGTALITASHAKSVVALSEGRRLSTAAALKLGLSGFGLVILAGLVYAIATIVGFVLVVIPGIFIAVAGIFTAQFAALERTGPNDSFKESILLVRSVGWWKTWGYVLVIGLIEYAFGFVVGFLAASFESGFDASDQTANTIFFLVIVVVQAVTLSYTALINTLLYFSWKARAKAPAELQPVA
jgi:hypothetical protein